MTKTHQTAVAPDFLAVEEAAAVLRIGRTCAYKLARQYLATDGASGLPVLRIGRLLRVPRIALEDLLGGPITWPLPNTEAAEEPEQLAARRRQQQHAAVESDDLQPQLFSA